MGLLDKLEHRRHAASGSEIINFEFESMSDEAIAKIVKFYKRLALRGYEFHRSALNLKNRTWIHNEDRTVFFFQQGCMDRKMTGTDYEENYYCLIYEGEMWSIHCTKSYLEFSTGGITGIEVLYYPEKLGRESNNEKIVRDIVLNAVEFMSGTGGMEQYEQRLHEILGEDSVNELLYLNEEWYDVIFGDEGIKRFMETKENEVVKKPADEPDYELELVSEIIYFNYFSNLNLRISGPYCLRPRVCAVNKENNIRCFKLLSTEDLSDGIQEYDNYIFVKENNVFVVQTRDIKELNTILISRIFVCGSTDMEEKSLIKNSVRGVREIEEVYRYEPMVDCSEELEIITDKDTVAL